MKTIPVQYDFDTEEYYYICPFCGQKTVCDDGEWNNCEHVIFGYEDINARPMSFNDVLYDKFTDILFTKRIDFLEGLHEIWNNDFKPQNRRSEDPDNWDDAKREAIEEYMNEFFSLEDFMKVLRCSNLKPLLKSLVIAQTEDDPEGWGKTSFVLSPNTEI